MEGNFGGGKHWRIWRMTINSPNFHQPNFLTIKNSYVIKFHVVLVMSILKYLKCALMAIQDEGLPEPSL